MVWIVCLNNRKNKHNLNALMYFLVKIPSLWASKIMWFRRNKTREGDHGIVVGEKDTKRVKVGCVRLPRRGIQTTNHCTVGHEALVEAVSWGTSLGRKLVGWIHTHPGHEPVLSALDVCTPNTIGQTLSSIILDGGPRVGVVQSLTSQVDVVLCTPRKGGLKASTMFALGTEVAN